MDSEKGEKCVFKKKYQNQWRIQDLPLRGGTNPRVGGVLTYYLT